MQVCAQCLMYGDEVRPVECATCGRCGTCCECQFDDFDADELGLDPEEEYDA